MTSTSLGGLSLAARSCDDRPKTPPLRGQDSRAVDRLVPVAVLARAAGLRALVDGQSMSICRCPGQSADRGLVPVHAVCERDVEAGMRRCPYRHTSGLSLATSTFVCQQDPSSVNCRQTPSMLLASSQPPAGRDFDHNGGWTQDDLVDLPFGRGYDLMSVNQPPRPRARR
jgi:hypothetical protein